MDLNLLIQFVVSSLFLIYGIFMLLFLNDMNKYEETMSDRDKGFRKAAVVITWISIVMNGLMVAGSLLLLIAGPQHVEYTYVSSG